MEMHHSAAVKELRGHEFRSGNHMSVLAMNKSCIQVGLSVKPEMGTFNIKR